MKINTSKSEIMVPEKGWISRSDALLHGEELLPQVEKVKYLGILFTSEESVEQEIDRRIRAVSAVLLSRTVVVKTELSQGSLFTSPEFSS